MKALILLIAMSAFATPAGAEPRQVFGYAGVLGEWELTADVTQATNNGTKEFSGPLSMKHVGICTQDGPEEKTGQIRFQISGLPSSMKATLVVDGVECTYSARLSDAYSGLMNCPHKPALPLTLWLK
jgi:hypothetical protein